MDQWRPEYREMIEEIDREILREERKRIRRLEVRLAKRIGDYSRLTQLCPEDIKLFERERELENVFAAEAKDRIEGRASSRWFITWNPSQTTDPVELWERVTGYLRKNDGRGIKSWYAVIEQRSEDGDSPIGWHMHVCVEFVDEFCRSTVYQKLRATAAYFWSESQVKMSEFKKNWLVVKPLEDYHRKYVEGEKRVEKMVKVAADKIARGKHGFPDFASGSEKIFPSEDIVREDGVCQEGEEVFS